MYTKLNSDPIMLECLLDARDDYDLMPSFEYEGRRYYLNDFIRVHGNPWIDDIFPDYIHGMESDCYPSGIYVEVIGDAVNVYR